MYRVKYKDLKNYFPVNTLGNCLSPSVDVHSLAVLFDSKFSFNNQVNSVIKSTFANLRNLHLIRCLLCFDIFVMVANALISSSLDYFNSMFHPKISQDSRILKIGFHTLLMMLQDLLILFQSVQWQYTF